MQRLDHFMATAAAAYYARHDPFHDFTTAPEITQAFGEILGLWCVVSWQAMGLPRPGRPRRARAGARHTDARRPPRHRAGRPGAAGSTPPPSGRDIAGATRPPAHPPARPTPPGTTTSPRSHPAHCCCSPTSSSMRCRSASSSAAMTAGSSATWRRVFSSSTRQRRRQWTRPSARPSRCASPPGPWRGGWRNAWRHRAGRHFSWIMARPKAHPATSLQGVRGGRPADPLAAPGETDITAHVDFAAFAAAAAAAAIHGPVPQGIFPDPSSACSSVPTRLARGKSVPEIGALVARRAASDRAAHDGPPVQGARNLPSRAAHTPGGSSNDRSGFPDRFSPGCPWLLHPPRWRLDRCLRKP